MEIDPKLLTEEQKELTLGIVAYLCSLDNIYSSGDTVIEIYWENPKYKNLFFWFQDQLSVENEELLKEFIEEVHSAEITKEFDSLVNEGICEKGLDSKGNMVYFPLGGLKSKDLIRMVNKRLNEKN